MTDRALSGALEGNGQDTQSYSAVLGKQRGGMACKGVQGGKPNIARRGAVAVLGLKVVQDGEQVLADQFGNVGGRWVPASTSLLISAELDHIAEGRTV